MYIYHIEIVYILYTGDVSIIYMYEVYRYGYIMIYRYV